MVQILNEDWSIRLGENRPDQSSQTLALDENPPFLGKYFSSLFSSHCRIFLDMNYTIQSNFDQRDVFIHWKGQNFNNFFKCWTQPWRVLLCH